MMQHSMQAWWDNSVLDSGNSAYLEELYNSYINDPNSIPPTWRKYFDTLPKTTKQNELGATELDHDEIKQYFRELSRQPKKVIISGDQDYTKEISKFPSRPADLKLAELKSIDLKYERQQTAVHDLINQYRLSGHLYSNIDPLNLRVKLKVPELELAYYHLNEKDFTTTFDAANLASAKELTLGEILTSLKRIYSDTAASEYMHIPDVAERTWVQEQIEITLNTKTVAIARKLEILERLTAAEGLEKYLANKYPGAKRFGLEGCDSFIVALDELINSSGKCGFEEIAIGMAHRGRLNVLVNILGKNPSELFDEFEGKHSKEVESGDVKYHQGFSSNVETPGGNVHLSLAFNPSHLEIVSPVVCGSVRAKQERRGKIGRSKVLSIAVHGDAAFAGQGVLMETLNMSQTPGYGTGGTIHVITNNQIGFTTSNALDSRSTLYCSDLGKMMSIPIFHVNAEAPENLCLILSVALAYKIKFQKDVIIDLVGYRQHGHNEADEPAATQPMMYKIIRAKKSARELYAEQLIKEKVITEVQANALVEQYRAALDARDKAVVKNLITNGWKNKYATNWEGFTLKDWRTPVKPAMSVAALKALAIKRDTIPANMKLHPRVQAIVDNRVEMTAEKRGIDWGYAETLAYATILVDGFDVRLSGQDSGRGTFFHRHVVWHDQNSGQTYTSLTNLDPKQNKFTVIDSLLSEAAVVAFEYGYATAEPRALIIWEAQFGDFANNAQVVIDQFISSGEQKWGRLCGLTMLLPHGYEGQGPEHSSARLERYLQLSAQHNIQVCVPSTPSQMFHLLRRQVLRPMRKPLIVLTPKSLLRHKLAVSTFDDLTKGQFYPIIIDDKIDYTKATKVVMCSGKVYYDLYEQREKDNRSDVAIIRIEQLYPFPEDELRAELGKYKNITTVVWCQEEPLNQGAWYNSQHHMRACLQNEQQLQYAGREASAAPAAGYMHLHNEQQAKLIADALK